MEEREHLEVFFFLSLLIHFLGLVAIRHAFPTQGVEMAREQIIELVNLKDIQLPFALEKQVVELPKPDKQEEPAHTRFLDDYSRRVAEETRSRHKGWKGTPYLEKPIGGAKKGEDIAKLDSNDTFLQRILSDKKGEGGQSPETGRENKLLPSYSQLKGFGPVGESQFLPDVKEGEITLLNTKSFTYASFVRRVAYRIFDHFILNIRNTPFKPEDITRINGFAYVEAVMDTKGNLVEIKLRQSSGSEKWDTLARDSCKAGAWDGNPPKGAESSDGYIHFIFAPSTDLLVVGLED